MSDTDDDRPLPRRDDEAYRTRAGKPEPDKAAGASGLARHRDPSLTKKAQAASAEAAKKAGVEWVRPSELLASRTAKLAGRGIDFHAELARRVRRLPGETYRASRRGVRTMSERARRLPPVTAFGRSAQSPQGATRSGIGLR